MPNEPPSLVVLAGRALPFDVFLLDHTAAECYLQQAKRQAIRTVQRKLRFPRLQEKTTRHEGPFGEQSVTWRYELWHDASVRTWTFKLQRRDGGSHLAEAVSSTVRRRADLHPVGNWQWMWRGHWEPVRRPEGVPLSLMLSPPQRFLYAFQ